MAGSASASGGSQSRGSRSQRSRSGTTSRSGQQSTSATTGETSTNTNSSKLDINRRYLVLFVKLFRLPEFQQQFREEKYKITEINNWIATVGQQNTTPKVVRDLHSLSRQKHERATKRTGSTEAEANTKNTKTTETASQSTKATENVRDSVLSVMNTQQVVQIFRAALSIHTYGKKDNRVYEIFKIAYEDMKLSPKYVVGTKYLPSILSSYKKEGPINFKNPSALEVLLFFHGCSVHKSSSCRHVATAGNRIGYLIQVLMSAWTRLFSLIENQTVGRIRDAFTPYIVFNQTDCRFTVLNSRAQGFSNAQMAQSLLRSKASKNMANVNVDAYNRDVHMDSAMRSVVSLFFKHLDKILCQPFLYAGSDKEIFKWKELAKFRLPTNVQKLPEAFKELPDTVCNTLGVDKDCETVESEEEGVGQVLLDVDSLEVTSRKRKRVEGQEGAQRNDETGTVIKTEPKEEPDLVDALENISFRPRRSKDLTENTKAQYEILNKLFKEYYNYFDVPLNVLAQECGEHGVEIENRVDLLLTDPPYNVRREGNKDNSDYDIFYESDIKDLCDLCELVLKPGGHGIIFCSFQQFEVYRKILNSYKTTVVDTETDRTGNTTCEKNLFVVEPTPIVVIKKDGLAGAPVRGGASHINMTEICIHFWKRAVRSGREATRSVDFNATPSFASRFPSSSNVISDVPPPLREEIRWVEEDQESATRDENGKSSKRIRRRKLRPEQKPVQLLSFLISKFTRPGDLVMDPCGGTFSTLHACMVLDKHRKFTGGDRDSECTLAVEDDLLRVFATQILNPKSDLVTDNLGYTKAAQTVRSHDLQQRLNYRFNAWALPDGLVAMQSFPDHILECICQTYNDFGLLSTYRRTDGTFNPSQKWSNKWIQRFNNMDPKMLLASECAALRVRIKPSTIKHPHVGVGVFARRDFRKGDIIGPYYGALVYGDLAKDHRSRKTYGSGIMSVSSQDYAKWALQIDFEFVDHNNQKHTGYICPGEFNAMRYINDARYTDGDREKDSFDNGTLENPREVNCAYLVNKNFDAASHFENHTAVQVVATTNIVQGQELFIDYGSKYAFSNSDPMQQDDNNQVNVKGSTKDTTNDRMEIDPATKGSTKNTTNDTMEIDPATKATEPAAKTAEPAAKVTEPASKTTEPATKTNAETKRTIANDPFDF